MTAVAGGQIRACLEHIAAVDPAFDPEVGLDRVDGHVGEGAGGAAAGEQIPGGEGTVAIRLAGHAYLQFGNRGRQGAGHLVTHLFAAQEAAAALAFALGEVNLVAGDEGLRVGVAQLEAAALIPVDQQ